jgi:hypothetical protein
MSQLFSTGRYAVGLIDLAPRGNLSAQAAQTAAGLIENAPSVLIR